MKNKYQLLLLLLGAVIYLSSSCKKHNDCSSLATTPICPYTDPIWHPTGKVIGFNHIPVKTETTIGSGCNMYQEYGYKLDSAGFWLVNADGTNQRRVLPYTLVTPSWSADGKWLTFANGGDIFKMPFDGQKLDTTTVVRITSTGNNYSPSWNYQSLKMAYGKTVCNGPGSCGIWLYDSMNAIAPYQFLVPYAAEPNWYHTTDTFLYYTAFLSNRGEMLGDTLWTYNLPSRQKQLLKVISTPYVDNRMFQTSPDDSKIAFISDVNTRGVLICSINIDGSNFKELTSTSTKGFTWSSDGRIVYVNFDYSTVSKISGTLWIMNADGSGKTQLTYNQLN
jgi:Tol biopolymer transport system component